MTSRRLDLVGLAALGLLFLSPHAWTQGPHLVEHIPAARVAIQGGGIDFFVRFDSPVDHVHSFLVITHDGKVIRMLHPRLEAAPEILFARASILTPGNYELHWIVQSMTGIDLAKDGIPFTVGERAHEQRPQPEVQFRNRMPPSKEPAPTVTHADR